MAQKFKNKIGQKRNQPSKNKNTSYFEGKNAGKIIRYSIIVLVITIFSFGVFLSTRFAKHVVTKHKYHKNHRIK